jgi:hypothetical protein
VVATEISGMLPPYEDRRRESRNARFSSSGSLAADGHKTDSSRNWE